MANSCESKVLAGLARDCSSSMGGISTVYMAAKDKVSDIKIGEDNKVQAITMALEEKMKEYHFRKGSGSMSSQFNIDQANGTNYVTTTLNLSFLRMETTKRIEMTALSVNELVVIVKDSNGIYWLLGKDEAVTASAGTAETGQARGDGNRYTLTLTDESLELPYEVPAEVVATVIA